MSMVSVEEAPTEIASRAIRIPTYRVQVASRTGSLAIGSSVKTITPEIYSSPLTKPLASR